MGKKQDINIAEDIESVRRSVITDPSEVLQNRLEFELLEELRQFRASPVAPNLEVRPTWINRRLDDGSIELVVLGMLAALIVLLAIPLFSGIEHGTSSPQSPAQQEKSSSDPVQDENVKYQNIEQPQ